MNWCVSPGGGQIFATGGNRLKCDKPTVSVQGNFFPIVSCERISVAYFDGRCHLKSPDLLFPCR